MSEFNQENQSIYNNYQQPQPGKPKFPWFKTIIVALILWCDRCFTCLRC